MEQYKKQVEVRWADLDPNYHMLHSKYYDLGAYVRMCFLTDMGITKLMQQHRIGPVIFREECFFKKEIRFGQKVEIDLLLSRSRSDSTRWSIRHQITVDDAALAAVINLDGAWIDLEKRKLAILPEGFGNAFDQMPRSDDYEKLI